MYFYSNMFKATRSIVQLAHKVVGQTRQRNDETSYKQVRSTTGTSLSVQFPQQPPPVIIYVCCYGTYAVM